MELKLRRITSGDKVTNGLNCTVMELKLILYYQKRQELPRLNCTVMELKHFGIDLIDMFLLRS